jgi:hypothetical protein
MAGVGAPWPVMGELVGEGREGDGEGERLVRWGCQGGCRRGADCRREAQPWLLRAVSLFVILAVPKGRKQEGGRRKEKRREEIEKKRRREGENEKEKRENFPNLEISGKK